MEILDKAVAERLARFRALAEKMEVSIALAERFLPEKNRGILLAQQREFHDRWPEVEASLMDRREEAAGRETRDGFLGQLAAARAAQGDDYIRVIRSLDEDARSLGTAWLKQAVDTVAEGALARVPSCRVSS